MNLDQFFQDYLVEFQSEICGLKGYEVSLFLQGCMGMYQKTKEECYIEILKTYAKLRITEEGILKEDFKNDWNCENYNLGILLFFLWNQTGETCYEKALKELGSTFSSNYQGNPMFGKEDKNLSEIYMVQPFYTLYDTIYNKKEHYLEIMEQFHVINQFLNDSKKATLLVDCFSGMSEEIYEHYFTLLNLTKTTIKEILAHAKEQKLLLGDNEVESSEAVENTIFTSYAVLKACHYKILLAEKYETVGANLFHAAMEQFVSHQKQTVMKSGQGFMDKIKMMGIFMMAYSFLLEIR
ncbi:glycoside hydrolase family 88 protein [Lachnoclostridium phytofermentans]|uniref:Glycosyl hydrolase family 88 n=1 Tax=Lachnoclostridium phytofermentans (strain ATCC 700394 / DSM 18823 / ISDg) TaxID=357809 RepID=A9KNI1_LACP7|nr:glycoside hydrolase family 88 protein [Lachnoclostridium phytofermentans]ABX43098.1 glycosyl hydrolase family 88 [Lachnoclostridium phytofermentans ISDg]